MEDEKGIVKASCCGLFSDQDDPEKLPPIYQFPLGGANNFSLPKKDDELWVMFFDDNPMELFYIRKDNFPENLQDILSKKYKEVAERCQTRAKDYDISKMAAGYNAIYQEITNE